LAFLSDGRWPNCRPAAHRAVCQHGRPPAAARQKLAFLTLLLERGAMLLQSRKYLSGPVNKLAYHFCGWLDCIYEAHALASKKIH
jgi:hypothetical protein